MTPERCIEPDCPLTAALGAIRCKHHQGKLREEADRADRGFWRTDPITRRLVIHDENDTTDLWSDGE
jgi:hypothetical protein